MPDELHQEERREIVRADGCAVPGGAPLGSREHVGVDVVLTPPLLRLVEEELGLGRSACLVHGASLLASGGHFRHPEAELPGGDATLPPCTGIRCRASLALVVRHGGATLVRRGRRT